MARRAVGLNVTSTRIGAEGFRGGGHTTDPINTVSTSATVAALAVVDLNTATLVAQGATPLQADVNTLAANVALLDTAVATLVAGTGPIPPQVDVVLSYDTTAVGNLSVLERAIAVLLRNVRSSNDFAS